MLVNSALQSSAKSISDMIKKPDSYMNGNTDYKKNILSGFETSKTSKADDYLQKCGKD